MKVNIKLLAFSTFALLQLPAFADVLIGARADNGRITVNYDSSVNSTYAAIYDNARNSWNGISSRVSVYKTSSYNSDYDLYKVYFSPISDPGLFGVTAFYMKRQDGSYVLVNRSSDIFRTSITIYDANITSDSIRQFVATHEVGHSLKLDHTTTTSPGNSVMFAAFYDALVTSPTNYDYGELKRKWGQ